MVEQFIDWLLRGLLDLGYLGIVALMAVESSVLPLPSELVMPPAGYWVAKGEMNAVAVVACGVLGSILGALANYGLAHWLGRGFLRRFGRYLFVSTKALDRTERYFAAHGEISTMMARMLPVIRHLISLPAGIARMSLPKFILYTGLGAFIWCGILTWIGYFLGQNEGMLRNEEVRRYVSRALLVLIPALAVVVAIYVLRHRRKVAQGRQEG
ncbi:MAG TPA: DedA family protein [Gemmatimonadales bacterium]|jgi:membrane protein DedA with SNARE-associated domain